jgi:hypothetical protein
VDVLCAYVYELQTSCQKYLFILMYSETVEPMFAKNPDDCEMKRIQKWKYDLF